MIAPPAFGAWQRAGRLDPAHHVPVRGRGLRGWLAPELDAAQTAALLRDPDAVMSAGAVLKDDDSARVVHLQTADAGLVMKRFRYPDPWRALRRAPRRSRARSAFVAGLRLAHFGVPVARPLGMLEAGGPGWVTASWLLTAWVPGHEAPELLADPAADPRQRERLVDRMTDLVASLQGARIAHGDLKATNLLIGVDGEPLLLDLHAVRRVIWPGHPALARDRRRYLRNLEPWPDLRARAGARLGA